MLMIQKRSPLMHKLISLLCLIAILLPLISISVPVQADAASSYKVKQWSDGNGTYYYYVYKGSLPRYYEPTFIRHDWMNYYSDSGNIRIAIYDPYGSPNKAQSEAFYKYLLSKTKARYTYAGWYSFSHSSYTSYHVYKIEGWTSNLSVNKLLNAGPFWNIDGEKLEVLNIGRGNVIHEKWSYIRNTLKCSVGLHLNTKNPKVGVTVGLRFTDVYGQMNTDAYT